VPSQTVLSRIETARIVPVVVLDDAEAARPLAAALLAGGLDLIEVTLRTPSALESIRAMAVEGSMLVGAGTVLSVAQVDQALEAGAQFVVSPGFSDAVVRRCQERGVLCLPGAVTATEIQRALEAGLGMVKFFPAETSGGPAAIRALSGPFAQMRFVPTGGVGLQNASDYLALPAVAAVGGTWMVSPELVAAGDFDGVAKRTRDAVALVREKV
jgi:2-dehydro-3-deoxyphosphogluconate aldolase/(4S)-4-hydroxy-2-oxoglutarate aldolase